MAYIRAKAVPYYYQLLTRVVSDRAVFELAGLRLRYQSCTGSLPTSMVIHSRPAGPGLSEVCW